ncbi:MAG: hypothetical protein JO112_17115, partial [Planctomycetes bacterium]|nr:hypothetical protein [Planctomycetota bacterium]
MDTVLWAASFPRGPGFYFSLPKLVVLLLGYFAWVSTCAWVDKDARSHRMPLATWNPVLWGCGALGLVVIWLLPWFWISFLFFLILYVAASLSYVTQRNEKVPEAKRVLTPHHLKILAARYLKLKLPETGEEEEAEIPLRFLGKSTTRPTADDNRR